MSTPSTTSAVAPLVTIVMPCFNGQSVLLESIESVKSQTYPNIELIIVDDGSTDSKTLAMLSDLESDGHTVLRKMNGGVSSAINAGVKAGTGQYFMPLGDDLIEAPYIAEAVAVLADRQDVGIVYCQATLFGTVVGPWLLPPFSMKRQLTDNCVFAAALFRASDWRSVDGYDESMRQGREDHDFVMRILSLGRKVHRLDGTYFHYRQGDEKSVNAQVGADRRRLVAAHAQILRNNRDLYAEHADLLWEKYFELIDDRNNLANRYRMLERLRRSPAGSRLVATRHMLARALRRTT